MRYNHDDLADDDFIGALISAGIALSTLAPIVLTQLLFHTAPFRDSYFSAGLAIMAVPIAYVAFVVVRGRRVGFLEIPPRMTFVLVAFAMLCVAFANAASGGNGGTYLPAFFLTTLFLGVVGDLHMRLSGLALATALFAWSAWEGGGNHHAYLPQVLIACSAMAVSQVMIAHAMARWGGLARSRKGLSELANQAMTAMSLDAGLNACLPLAVDVFPASRALVFARPDGSAFFLRKAWPEQLPGDEDLTSTEDFRSAVGSTRPVIGSHFCFVSIGQTGTEELVLVLDRKEARFGSTSFLGDLASSLATGFLRLVNRTSYLSTLESDLRVDALTGLANRLTLDERLTLEIEMASHSSRPLCIAMIDLDHYKGYNDAFGHAAGDQLLRSVAGAFSKTLRTGDLLARYGGDEFCAVLPDTTLESAMDLGERLREAVTGANSQSSVTASIGIATWERGHRSDELISAADSALYEAKAHGRNHVEAAPPGRPGRAVAPLARSGPSHPARR